MQNIPLYFGFSFHLFYSCFFFLLRSWCGAFSVRFSATVAGFQFKLWKWCTVLFCTGEKRAAGMRLKEASWSSSSGNISSSNRYTHCISNDLSHPPLHHCLLFILKWFYKRFDNVSRENIYISLGSTISYILSYCPNISVNWPAVQPLDEPGKKWEKMMDNSAIMSRPTQQCPWPMFMTTLCYRVNENVLIQCFFFIHVISFRFQRHGSSSLNSCANVEKR